MALPGAFASFELITGWSANRKLIAERHIYCRPGVRTCYLRSKAIINNSSTQYC